MRYKAIVTVKNGLVHEKYGDVGKGPYIEDFAEKIGNEHPEWGINKDTFKDFSDMSIKEAKELDVAKVTNPLVRLKTILKNKAKTYELLYTKNKALKNSENIVKDVAQYDNYINTIINVLYEKEIEYAKQYCNTEDDEYKKAITDSNNEITSIKKNHLMKLGLSNVSKHIDTVNNNLGKNESLGSKLIDNLNNSTKAKGTMSLEERCNDYKALQEHLNRKNPIARFFSFGAKLAMRRFRNEIAKETKIKDRNGIEREINNNASLESKDLMNDNKLKEFGFNAEVELDAVIKGFVDAKKKEKASSPEISPNVKDILAKNKGKHIDVKELDDNTFVIEDNKQVNNENTLVNSNSKENDSPMPGGKN